jgi:ABC-type antimicrobial peptide transport system permease subunit
MHRLANVEYFSSIVLRAERWDRMNEVAAEAARILARTHRPVGNQPLDFTVLNQRLLVETQMVASARLARYVSAVGLGALLVCGVGMLAISWMSVTERAAEIGLRRTLGATRIEIFVQFLLEAAVLALIGCLLGLVAGVVLALGIGPADLRQHLAAATLARATAAALLVSAAFSSLPAYRAAILDPIRALRPH